MANAAGVAVSEYKLAARGADISAVISASPASRVSSPEV
jgi:hypothetical protein